MDLRSQRGSGIVLAVIVVLVLAVIGVAMIRASSRELAGATAARQADAIAACAEAGRQLLIGQFRNIGASPTSITALNESLGGSMSAVGGHVDQDPDTVQVDQVKLLPAGSFGSSRGAVADITNIIGGIGNIGAGQPFRVIVHCTDSADSDGTGGRQIEVECGVQFGI